MKYLGSYYGMGAALLTVWAERQIKTVCFIFLASEYGGTYDPQYPLRYGACVCPADRER